MLTTTSSTSTTSTGFSLCSRDYRHNRHRLRHRGEAAPFVTSLPSYVITSSPPISSFNPLQHFFDLTLLRPPRYAYSLMCNHGTLLASSPRHLSSLEEIHAHRIA